MTHEEAERELAHRQGLPWEERRRLAKETRWSLPNWLYWFRPGERLWSWWRAVMEDSDTLYVGIADAEFPHGGGPVDWLLRVCGSSGIHELPPREYASVLRKLGGDESEL